MESGQKNNDLQKSGSEILAILLSKLNLSAYQLALNCKYERPQAVYDVQNGKTKKNRPIFNYVRIMQKHADNAMRMILDELK